MEIFIAAGLAALVKKAIDALRYLAGGRDYLNALITQAVLSVGATHLADNLGGLDLTAHGAWAQVLFGLIFGSTASVGNDLIQAYRGSKVVHTPPPPLVPALTPTEAAPTDTNG
jgi:hypothetical protein